MYRKWKKALAGGLAAAFLGMQPVMAMPPLLPTGEVTEGMSGTAYTIVDESGEIRPFQVDVVGVIRKGKATPMIMAKASGPLIEATGGILQGMSGSPIYVEGRLMGALASTLKEMSPYTFFITPIEDMIPLWDMPDKKNQTHLVGIDLKKLAEEREKKETEQKAKEEAAEEKDKKAETGEKTKEKAKKTETEEKTKKEPVSSTEKAAVAEELSGNGETAKTEEKSLLYLSGFDESARSYLLDNVFHRDQGMSPMDAVTYFPGGQGTDYHASLEPGSMIGVALTYGDFSIGTAGTVTAVEGKKILGFGHHFLHKGNVNYFLTEASVVGTVSAVSGGTKMANIGNIIGRISQDRETGVAGELGVFPDVVPMKIAVKDNILGREKNYGVRIAYDEELLPQISASVAYAALSKTMDTMGEGTAQVHFTIRTDAAEDGKAERTNMFYNTSDIGKIAVLELAQAVDIICSNAERESDIVDIQVDIDVKDGRKTAVILSAIPDKTKVKPGDTVNFTTTIKPYRGEKVTLTIPYTVPKHQRAGALSLDVRGGGLIPIAQLLGLPQGADPSGSPADADKNLSTKEKLKNFLSTTRNNEIVIVPGAVQNVMDEKAQKKAVREAVREAAAEKKNGVYKESRLGLGEAKEEKEAKFATDYIIENAIHATLQVEKQER